MSTEDPERLLADALRAQAASAPLPPTPAESPVTATGQGVHLTPGDDPAVPGTGGHEVAGLGPGYGLISGSGVDGPPDPLVTGAGQPAPPAGPAPAASPAPGAGEPSRPLAAGWVLLLAVLLGLAAGAVAALITLL
ncbi:hypothetical protein [Gandjariella thermophila]|uniref:Uncharacterized protein n=1 Tax=Gandjariella thermophila TaxID=1931992 RepID=A0A4D4JCK4_9PSEU|nr:hypothetical protein [Gandjariella thermophila]GDY32099.1 hypothetical protein GTS_37320 [Gandjariella thermophila]